MYTPDTSSVLTLEVEKQVPDTKDLEQMDTGLPISFSEEEEDQKLP